MLFFKIQTYFQVAKGFLQVVKALWYKDKKGIRKMRKKGKSAKKEIWFHLLSTTTKKIRDFIKTHL